jgi:hypothetical protein
MGGIKSKTLKILNPVGAWLTDKTGEAVFDPLYAQQKASEQRIKEAESSVDKIINTSEQNSATAIAAKEAARIEALRLKKKKGFRSTILTGPLGDPNNPPLSKTEIL